ncbi:hypothetical protein [Leifsonia sp. 71-9]|uniref:hypothetical protein n=1 Tax=Leifsonia sp. 71-9 TaxID=1895934 RepID=UPI0025C3F3C4|nr:hypothetical protein [Leifsonia sp. 71-9]
MRDADDIFKDRLNALPDVDRRTAVFVKMMGSLAQVNTGPTTIMVPCVGFTPPVPGMTVQMERTAGQWKVTGPAVALPAVGTITATGSPTATVTIGGGAYTLFYRSGYTPTLGDSVEVNWATGVIQGRITGSNSGTDPGTNPGGGPTPLPGDPVLATNSGQYRSRWQSNDVRASDSVSGAWFYSGRVAAALTGASVSKVEIYLPLRTQVGVCNIGTHGYADMPGGWTGIANSTALNPRGGWVSLPLSFVSALAAGGGIAVTSGNGDNQWSGTQSDPLSGALRFQGTR